MEKTLIILVGPKGAGKTTIGMMAQEQGGIRFLRVESIWLNLQPGENGWQRVEQEVDRLLAEHDRILIESLGAGEDFPRMLASFQQRYAVKLVRVWTELPACLERVRQRNSADHIPVSDAKVQQYNEIAAQVQYPWAAVIDNNEFVTADQVVRILNSC